MRQNLDLLLEMIQQMSLRMEALIIEGAVLGDGFKHQTDSHNLEYQMCQFEFLMMFPGGFLSNPST
jgi:hypothetical protein